MLVSASGVPVTARGSPGWSDVSGDAVVVLVISRGSPGCAAVVASASVVFVAFWAFADHAEANSKKARRHTCCSHMRRRSFDLSNWDEIFS